MARGDRKRASSRKERSLIIEEFIREEEEAERLSAGASKLISQMAVKNWLEKSATMRWRRRLKRWLGEEKNNMMNNFENIARKQQQPTRQEAAEAAAAASSAKQISHQTTQQQHKKKVVAHKTRHKAREKEIYNSRGRKDERRRLEKKEKKTPAFVAQKLKKEINSFLNMYENDARRGVYASVCELITSRMSSSFSPST